MIETKADALEASFEGVEMGGVVTRPLLSGAREPGGAFEGFLRSGASVEMKSFSGTSPDTGGYAVPREIDAAIDATLKSISPIRSVANVVKVGSAGYRKLVTSGGTPSGARDARARARASNGSTSRRRSRPARPSGSPKRRWRAPKSGVGGGRLHSRSTAWR
ncbi:hypothetical protein BH09PSE4_BH09PSE4_13640 [soil metagenome]